MSIVTEAILRRKSRARRELYKSDPGLWAEEYLGIKLWAKQREIGLSIVENRGTLVAAGHSVGKSYSAALYVCWWVDVHDPDEVFVATTAPSAAQLRIIWDYIRKFHSLAKRRYEEGLVDHELPGYITGDNSWKMDNGLKIGEGRKPPNQAIDSAFQGRHAPYLLAVIDEAVGVPQGFIEAIGNMATGEHNRQLMIANPTSLTSAMYKTWQRSEADPDSFWNRVTISVMDSPLIVDDPYLPAEEASGMSGWDYVHQALETFGSEDDPRYQARVLGQWAQDEGDTVFTPEEIASAHNTFVRVDPARHVEIGCDIARLGADRSVVYIKEFGEVWETDDLTGEPTVATGREGVRIRKVDSWSKAPIVNGTADNPDTTTRIHEIAMNYGARRVKVDASGIGGSVIDGLSGVNTGSYQVVEIFGGAAASDPRTYVNARAEQAFELKLAMQRGEVDLDPDDTVLTEELSAVQYERTERQLVKLESKDSLRRRGRKSPDYYDALIYAFQDVSELFEESTPDSGVLEIDDLEFDLMGLPGQIM